jgi:5-formyltetrahydrofolate cyclo-ligase
VTHPSLDRNALRRHLIAQREALPDDQRRVMTQLLIGSLALLLEHLSPRVLGFCWPYRGEPDLLAYLSVWQSAVPQRVLALPVVPDQPGPLKFHLWQAGQAMQTDRFGIPAPLDSVPAHPQVLLVPVNGFDARGYRLGYGGGFFDRTLALMSPAPITIGVGFEIGRLEDVTPQAHDKALDWMVTEAGVVVRPASSLAP